MIDLFKSKRGGSVLGLSLDGNRLEAVVLRRNNGTMRVRQSVSADLTLSPLTDDPELVGREIRNHLDKAGVRERSCAVCLPLGWLLTLQTELPELPEAERESFLQLEAERGFHGGPEALLIVNSLFQPKGGKPYATMLGVPRGQLGALERVLRAAKLKPVASAPCNLPPPTRSGSSPWRYAATALICKSAAAAALSPCGRSMARWKPRVGKSGFPLN